MDDKYTMNCLGTGQKARISDISLCGAIRRRFFDIGFVPGNEVECVCVSPLGDPKAYLVNDTIVAIRTNDSKLVTVEML